MTRLDPLVERVLPVLVHRLANQTQLLTGLVAVLRSGGLDPSDDAELGALVASRCADVARAGAETRIAGYALAVLGSALGHDLLLARRDRRGIEFLVDLALEALRREGLEPTCDPGESPDLAADALDGWQVPWGVARFVAATADAGARRWTWEPRASEDGPAVLVAAPSGTFDAREIERLLPGAEVGEAGGEARLHLPAAWLAVSRTSRG